ncbi:phage tail protein [Edaphovirga cremea]|uniref:phage tail protein n=1 Tax=Edaphovirga cremea TaxID=2267246 RepID=UPI000DEFFEC1|nr:phage tail protein [Edaphovirga cremea]
MGYALPNGATVHIASAYDTKLIVSGISNAASAVVTTSAAHTLKVGDIIQLSSGWSSLDNIVARISVVAGSTLTLEDINTTDTGTYAPGAGGGSLRKIVSWAELPQITEVANAGGEQQNIQVQFLSDNRQRNLDTFKSAQTQTFTLAHDSSLPIYPILRAADKSGDFLAAKMYVPKAKENRYWCASVSFNQTPVTAVNAIETVSVILNMQSPGMTFYKPLETVPAP